MQSSHIPIAQEKSPILAGLIGTFDQWKKSISLFTRGGGGTMSALQRCQREISTARTGRMIQKLVLKWFQIYRGDINTCTSYIFYWQEKTTSF